MIRPVVFFLVIYIIGLAAGCDRGPELSICSDYIENVTEKRFRGFIAITEDGISYQIPVTVDVVLSVDRIELAIRDDSQSIYSAEHKYRCILIEDGTLPLIEILDSNNTLIGCIGGYPSSIINYDLEVVPNATSTVARVSL